MFFPQRCLKKPGLVQCLQRIPKISIDQQWAVKEDSSSIAGDLPLRISRTSTIVSVESALWLALQDTNWAVRTRGMSVWTEMLVRGAAVL